jgi:Rps23 Pro-64 3,4-dihydroxylase Tpa1-like proline 4-hydroxylase
MKLRDALYSEEVRAFIGEVTGHRGLTARVDMAASAYSQGSHLLCHDDVIGTRAVSFIVYLTEPGWSAEDGGALELYSLEPESAAMQAGVIRGIPRAAPSKQILPLVNTMAFFGVEPGVS